MRWSNGIWCKWDWIPVTGGYRENFHSLNSDEKNLLVFQTMEEKKKGICKTDICWKQTHTDMKKRVVAFFGKRTSSPIDRWRDQCHESAPRAMWYVFPLLALRRITLPASSATGELQLPAICTWSTFPIVMDDMLRCKLTLRNIIPLFRTCYGWASLLISSGCWDTRISPEVSWDWF